MDCFISNPSVALSPWDFLPVLQLKKGPVGSDSHGMLLPSCHVWMERVPTTWDFGRGWESLVFFLDWTSQIWKIRIHSTSTSLWEPASTRAKSLPDLLPTSVQFPRLNRNLSQFPSKFTFMCKLVMYGYFSYTLALSVLAKLRQEKNLEIYCIFQSKLCSY